MNRKEWLIATILTLITIVSWVIFDILHTRSTVEISPKVQEIITPIDPNLNTSSLESNP